MSAGVLFAYFEKKRKDYNYYKYNFPIGNYYRI